MNFNEYKEQVLRTESCDNIEIIGRLSNKTSLKALHAVIGISTEAAELLDPFKKYVFYGKDPSGVNIIEELGDLLWYFALLCDAMNIDFDQIMEKNIAKLKIRYKNGFSKYEAINRDTEKELEDF